MVRINMKKILALIVFVCIVVTLLCSCGSIGRLEQIIEKTPLTEVELPSNDEHNILDDYFDTVFGTSSDKPEQSPENSLDNSSNIFGPKESETSNVPSDEIQPSGTESNGSYLRVDYVDVGQADFIVVECDGTYMTIDAGNAADGQFIYSYLDQRGIDHIEYLVVTHGHEDHVGSAATLLEHSTVGTVYCSVTEYDSATFRKFVSKVEEKGHEIVVPAAGDTFAVGSATVQVLGPVKKYDEPNDMSLVLKLTYGNTTFLFTGDAETQSEKDILDAGSDVSADVLKVGHHGSYTSSSYAFLREVMPAYCIIQSSRADAPEYDHPHNVVLSRLRDLSATVYRNDLQGTITCYSNGINITFEVERSPDANTLYELDKEH